MHFHTHITTNTPNYTCSILPHPPSSSLRQNSHITSTFIKNYSLIAAPIVKYLKKDAKIDVKDQEYVDAFNKLKQILTSSPLLAFPDINKPFVVTTDASCMAIGAVLSQANRPVCYASRTLNGHEKNYSTLEQELLAIIWALKYFRPYLYEKKFTVQTDHQALNWLFSMKDPSPRIIRWRILVGEFNFDIEYIKGKNNRVADFLSRNPIIPGNDENINYDIKSLFENSINTQHSAVENLNDHFVISEFIVNKYLTQIRILKRKNKEFEVLYNKYKIIYICENDLSQTSYLVDLFRRYLSKGKVGIYCELCDEDYNIIQQKLIDLYSNDPSIKFTKCAILAADILTKEELFEIIENVHIKGNHRGVTENYEKMKFEYFFPKLKKYINKFINHCKICCENKFDRNPIKKYFIITETPNGPNQIVHIDIFTVGNMSFLTSIDKFTKMASVHKIYDRNMCTIRVKLLERFSYLGVPSKLVMDNEFNNVLIRMFCAEHNIETHFTTPGSHTGNADIERFHLNILEHLRILKNSQNIESLEETVIRAVGYYNNTIHSATKVKPFDFLDLTKNLDLKQIKSNIENYKIKTINKINIKREEPPEIKNKSIYIKNAQAIRNKLAKRYQKHNKNNPNKIDKAMVKRPLKSFSNV